MPELDIWGTTRMLIEIYGANAVTTAAQRAERLTVQGNREGALRWQQITNAVQEMVSRRQSRDTYS
jgi:hypothetical protein